MMNHIHLSIAAAFCASMLSSCASGPQYSGLKKSGAIAPHNGKGMVLIYRTPGLMGAGTKPYIWANKTEMPGKLSRGGFYSYEAAPGPLNVEFSWHDHYAGVGENIATGLTSGLVGLAIDNLAGHKKHGLDISVLPNQTHYILMDGYGLSQVPQQQAERDIEECHWLNPK